MWFGPNQAVLRRKTNEAWTDKAPQCNEEDGRGREDGRRKGCTTLVGQTKRSVEAATRREARKNTGCTAVRKKKHTPFFRRIAAPRAFFFFFGGFPVWRSRRGSRSSRRGSRTFLIVGWMDRLMDGHSQSGVLSLLSGVLGVRSATGPP